MRNPLDPPNRIGEPEGGTILEFRWWFLNPFDLMAKMPQKFHQKFGAESG